MADDRGRIADSLYVLQQEVMARTPIVQSIVAVESSDRGFSWIGAAGDAGQGGARVGGDIPFFIASIDKLLNATVALMLVEQGRLDLDDPITAHLPPAITRGLHCLGGREHTAQITVRHLMTHTSGLADWLEDRPRQGPSLFERVLSEGDVALSIEDMAALVRDQLTPHFTPQDLSGRRRKARYSDTNYILLIAILEAITGQPLPEVHERLLYRPLAMRHTYFAGRSQPLAATAEPLVLRASGDPLHIPRLLQSVRGIYSTAGDMLTFMRGLMGGAIFHDQATLPAMADARSRFGFPLDRAALRAPGWPIAYGLGLMHFHLPRLFSPRSPMPSVIGHTGSVGCWLFYCQELDLLLTGSVDEVTAGAMPYRLVPKILRAFTESGRGAAGS